MFHENKQNHLRRSNVTFTTTFLRCLQRRFHKDFKVSKSSRKFTATDSKPQVKNGHLEPTNIKQTKEITKIIEKTIYHNGIKIFIYTCLLVH